MMRGAFLFATAATLCVSATIAAQVQIGGPVRDAPGGLASAKGTALVSGVILADENTPRPLRRARVTLVRPGTPGDRSTDTDDNGRFSFTEVPAGSYNLSATKGGFVRMAYGAKRHDRPGTTIVLTDAQQMTGITLKLARGSVISGTIIDETGTPAVGVQVRAMQYRLQAGGERTLLPVTLAGTGGLSADTTDDHGVYRLFGLPAGEFIVSLQPRLTAGTDVRAMTEEEMRSALAALQQPTTGRAGGTPGTQAPRPPAPTPVTVGYAPVFYPGTTNPASASAVTLGSGDQRLGVDFAVQMVRTAKIEGQVSAPAGVSLQGVQLLLVPAGGSASLGLTALNRIPVAADGKFSYSGVVPGQYLLTARTGRTTTIMSMGGDNMSFVTATAVGSRLGGPGSEGPAPPPPPSLWGLADLSVNGEDLANIGITLQPGMTMTGRLAFDAVKMPVPKDLSRARINLTPVGTSGAPVVMTGGVQVDATGKFTATGLAPGKYMFSVAMPPEAGTLGQWALRSAVAAGRDAADFPLEIRPNEVISDAVLTMTDQTQDVSGMLQDGTGRPAPDYTIVVFPAEQRLWLAGSRRIKIGRPGTDGKFSLAGLPAGDYRIAAVTDIAPNETSDPAFLLLLQEASVPFTLAPGQKRVQDFKIGG